MLINMQYGQDGLNLDLPRDNVTVIRPQHVPGLEDEQKSFIASVNAPIQTPPLVDLIQADDRIAVVIADITRPLPSERLLTWLFSELRHVPRENFTIIIGTGSHRACTVAEIESMVGIEVARGYRIINHNSFDDDALEVVGHLDGEHGDLKINREYVRADKRILLGFIEPHFMAGFSGGYKAVFPGIAGIEAIMYYHRAEVIGHPRSTWGVLEDNPTQTQIREYGSMLPVDFCINVTMNRKHEITRIFCGNTFAVHEQGCAFVKETAMVSCERPFPIVITSNSGHPLDQNLYQTVKGMCAAAEIISSGGLIVTCARCNDGFPDHGNFTDLLREYQSPQALLDAITVPGFHMMDQWQAQKLAQVQITASVALYSEIVAEELMGVQIEPVVDLDTFLEHKLGALGPEVPVAVLPEGPMSIPYLS